MRDSAKTRSPAKRRAAPTETAGGALSGYRKKRDFARTPEPPPEQEQSVLGDLAFVVQKHAARSLHWDFRLEHGGVLWSWAVPKGPSMDPADRRLAVRVEDHPLAYAKFEGRIPAGEYGAGTVDIWDRGTWRPGGEPVAALSRGELKFTLRGTRLTGGFVLVRLKPRPRERGDNWLLIKEHDGFERPGADAKALEVGERAP
jgi:bifunctional non-homologous end joining protein LigD